MCDGKTCQANAKKVLWLTLAWVGVGAVGFGGVGAYGLYVMPSDGLGAGYIVAIVFDLLALLAWIRFIAVPMLAHAIHLRRLAMGAHTRQGKAARDHNR